MNLLNQLTKLMARLYSSEEIREEGTTVPIQTGALPYRLVKGKRPEVLLVTGRRSGKWMVPKGWPMPGKSLAKAAAREAFEEAGVEGTIDPEPLGSFRHVKQDLITGDLEVNILVHALAVQRERSKWPESGERQRRWFKLQEAADSVDSEDLRKLILALGERIGSRAAA